jgi:hypothetical protein
MTLLRWARSALLTATEIETSQLGGSQPRSPIQMKKSEDITG